MDEGQRNHLINQYLSRIADLWIPTDTTAEKVSFVNFLATAINSWRPIRAEYFHEPTTRLSARIEQSRQKSFAGPRGQGKSNGHLHTKPAAKNPAAKRGLGGDEQRD